MIDGVIKKNLSRRFKIKTVYGQDDPKCMEEVVTRRLYHSVELSSEEKEKIKDIDIEKIGDSKGFGKLPDLILADGGITQIRAIKKVETKIGKSIDIGVYGMVKNDKHETRALIDENRKVINISDDLFNLITNFQNAVHDNANSYHRFLRDKSMTKSKLDEISGIGTVKKLALLKEFNSVENIKNADISEIIKVKGINEELAKKIKESL